MRRDMPFTVCRKRRMFDLPPPNVRRDMPFKACRSAARLTVALVLARATQDALIYSSLKRDAYSLPLR